MSRFQKWSNQSQDKILSQFTEVVETPQDDEKTILIVDDAIKPEHAKTHNIAKYISDKRWWEKKRVGEIITKYDSGKKKTSGDDYVPYADIKEVAKEDINETVDKVMDKMLYEKLEIIKEKPCDNPAMKKYLEEMEKVKAQRAAERDAAKKSVLESLTRNSNQKDGATKFVFNDDDTNGGAVMDEYMDYSLCQKLGIDPPKQVSEELKKFNDNNTKILEKESARLKSDRALLTTKITKIISSHDEGNDVSRRFGYEEPDDSIVRFDT